MEFSLHQEWVKRTLPSDGHVNMIMSIVKCNCSLFKLIILENFFLDEPHKTLVMNSYIAYKRRINIILRCIRRYRKKRLVPSNEFDLSCTPFNEINPSLWMDMIVDNTKYRFKYSDLYNIIESSLTHQNNMISIPLPIKNPYTGLTLTKPSLYWLFIHMKHIPPSFMIFMKCDFDLQDFLMENESYLRSDAIHRTIRGCSDDFARSIIQEMILYTKTYNVRTDQFEPIISLDKLKVDILTLKPLLLYYYNSLYSFNPSQRDYDYNRLLDMLEVVRIKSEKI